MKPDVISSVRTGLTLAIAWIFLLSLQSSEAPRIGHIDFYGLRRVTERQVLERLHVKRGDPTPVSFGKTGIPFPSQLHQIPGISKESPLPQDTENIKSRLQRIAGVRRAQLTTVCCEPDGTATLFVGIEEEGAPRFDYDPEPNGSVLLPLQIVEIHDQFEKELVEAVTRGEAQEDDSQGHALLKGEAFEMLQREFISFANSNLQLLQTVLSSSSNAQHRAIAAWVLGYADDKKSVAKDLLRAVRDRDEEVRNNATRALGAIASLANRKPQLGITINPYIFIEMLHSLSWTDRNKATMVLQHLTNGRPSEICEELRNKALLPIVEMARWKDSHSLMSLTLIGRIGGFSDEETEHAWKTGARDRIISSVLARKSNAMK
jgi:hypothetical protein